jgi:hypothetical protein
MNRPEFLRMMKGFEGAHPSGPTIDGLLEHIARVAEKAPHGGAIYAAHTYVQGPARSEVLVVPQSGWKFRDPKSINGMMAHLMCIAGSQRSLKSNLMKWVAYNYGVWDMTSQIIVLAPKRPKPEPSPPAPKRR